MWARTGGRVENHIYVLACRGQRSVSNVILQEPSTLVFKARFLTESWGSTVQLDMPASKPQGSTCVCLTSTRTRSVCVTICGSLHELWGVNASPRVCAANTVPTELSSQPPRVPFHMQSGGHLFASSSHCTFLLSYTA